MPLMQEGGFNGSYEAFAEHHPVMKSETTGYYGWRRGDLGDFQDQEAKFTTAHGAGTDRKEYWEAIAARQIPHSQE
jgi:hypothetical protein